MKKQRKEKNLNKRVSKGKEESDFGYIYKVTNTINGKSYVGQTHYSVELRWQRHVSDAHKTLNHHPYFHNAIKKYGKQSFRVEVLEKCPVSELNARERYWIAFFDTYHNGYNSTIGGEGAATLEPDEPTIVSSYESGTSIRDIARNQKLSACVVRKVLLKNNCRMLSLKERHRLQNGISVCVQFETDSFNFSSYKEAGEFVIRQGISNCRDYKVAASAIRPAVLCGIKLYGGIWTSNKYSEEYIQKYKETAKLRNQQYPYKKKQDTCPNCGNQKDIGAKLCMTCYQKEKFGGLSKPDAEELKILLETMTNQDVAAKYGIHISTVRKWIREYGITKSSDNKNPLPQKEEFISLLEKHTIPEVAKHYAVSTTLIQQWKKEFGVPVKSDSRSPVYCKELNRTFDSIREAQKFVYPECNSKSVCNCISKSCKTGKKYKGYHWNFINLAG